MKAEFPEPVDADFEARLNGEYLWGRHFAYHHGKCSFRFPFLFRSKATPAKCNSIPKSTLTEDINIDTIRTCLGFKKSWTC